MNYAAFEEMAGGTLARHRNEDEQTYMERVCREGCRSDGFCGADTPCSIYRINDMLCPEFGSCSAERQTLTLRFRVREWMLNPKGTLHGGVMSTMMDMTMGMLTRYYRQTNAVSTVDLSLSFLRPVYADAAVEVCAEVVKCGRTVVFLRAGMISAGKPVAAASATFM